jgi:hypothetical protein
MEPAAPARTGPSDVLQEAHRGITQEVKRIFVCLEHDVEGMVTSMQTLAEDLDGRITQQHNRLKGIEAEKRRCQALLGELQGVFGLLEKQGRSPGGVFENDGNGDGQPAHAVTPLSDKFGRRGPMPSPRTEMNAAWAPSEAPPSQPMRDDAA